MNHKSRLLNIIPAPPGTHFILHKATTDPVQPGVKTWTSVRVVSDKKRN